MVTASQVKVAKNVNIASLATNVLGLAIWIGVLARIIFQKDKLWGLILICCLMIAYQITSIIYYQVQYTFFLKVYEEQDINFRLYVQSINASWFL